MKKLLASLTVLAVVIAFGATLSVTEHAEWAPSDPTLAAPETAQPGTPADPTTSPEPNTATEPTDPGTPTDPIL